ncbi:MAG TPA: DUF6089 family protein [Panacibacter sp.]|nr:DUF6089 family protein [Panacibacter sp.]
MKYISIIVFIFFISPVSDAQDLYLNIGGGIMNYGGDLQEKNFTLNQSSGAFSLGLSYRLSDYFSVSSSYTFGVVHADDKLSNTSNAVRNLNFKSAISEGNLLLEAQLKNVPAFARFTPYLFGGLAVFHFNPYTYDTSGNKAFLQPLHTEGQGLVQYPDRKVYNLTQFAIPFGFGVRYALSDQVLISCEFGFRKLFTDYLDDVSTSYADTTILYNTNGALSAALSFRGDELKPPVNFRTGARRGNPEHNDTYYTCLIKLSFSISSISGAGSSSFHRIQKQTGCPRKVL